MTSAHRRPSSDSSSSAPVAILDGKRARADSSTHQGHQDDQDDTPIALLRFAKRHKPLQPAPSPIQPQTLLPQPQRIDATLLQQPQRIDELDVKDTASDPWFKVKAETTRAHRVVSGFVPDGNSWIAPATSWIAPATWTPSGRYVRVKNSSLIGRGAYGVVVKVVDLLSGHTRARKRQAYDGYPSPRLLFEIEALSRVQRNEGIAEILDITYTKSSIDIIMPLYEGTLQDLIDDQEGRELRPRRSKQLSKQLISAVSHIHRHGLVHLDLKPGNLMITRDFRLKIVDFGLAQAVGATTTSPTVGTIGYAAPESIMGSMRPTFQNDVWSVGCIIAEMYMGRPLFAFHDEEGAMRDILKFTGHPGGPVYPPGKYPSPVDCDVSTSWGPYKSDASNRLQDIDNLAADLIVGMLLLNPNRRRHLATFIQDPLFNRPSEVTS